MNREEQKMHLEQKIARMQQQIAAIDFQAADQKKDLNILILAAQEELKSLQAPLPAPKADGDLTEKLAALQAEVAALQKNADPPTPNME
jgi:hypothetical protein